MFLKSKSGKKVEYFSTRAGGTSSKVMATSWRKSGGGGSWQKGEGQIRAEKEKKKKI